MKQTGIWRWRFWAPQPGSVGKTGPAPVNDRAATPPFFVRLAGGPPRGKVADEFEDTRPRVFANSTPG